MNTMTYKGYLEVETYNGIVTYHTLYWQESVSCFNACEHEKNVLLFCFVLFYMYFCRGLNKLQNMTTSISLSTAEYDFAKKYAQERNITIDELFKSLIRMLSEQKDDEQWYHSEMSSQPYTIEELDARINEAEAQFDRGEYKTHEQFMDELKEEFSWLR